jgi:DNA repair exonuclease SbcCD nuclease subunit
MSKNMLKSKGLDYIALGHIHKKDYDTEENQTIIYPGSAISLGFDELGEHGMIVGNLQKGHVELEFVPLDEEKFKEIEIDITDILSKEELIEKINELEIKSNEYIKVILIGNRNFEINKYEILKYIENDRIIKIKNHTKIAYDLIKMSNENTLKGLFAKEMLEKLSKTDMEEDKEIIEKAIEIGLEALE